MNGHEGALPIEQFIQALTTQLDHAQSAMALKANNLNLPLTFAVKDLSLDLRTHIEFVKSEVRIRPAGPGEQETSTIRLSLTTITKPMIEENAVAQQTAADDPSIKDVGTDLTDEEQKRLEWVGVQTVSQLRRLKHTGAERAVERVADLPVDRLRRALQRASEPMVMHVLPLATATAASRPFGEPPQTLMSIRGRNLTNGDAPKVTIGGEPVRVVSAREDEVVVAPLAHQLRGTLTIEAGPNGMTQAVFDLAAHRPEAARAAKLPDGGEATA